MKPSSCVLDIPPLRFLKEAHGSVSPYILSIINTSLLTGSVPAYFKDATVQPLLKKPSWKKALPDFFTFVKAEKPSSYNNAL